MTYFQQSLKKTDGLFPVMSLMMVQTRSAPVENTPRKKNRRSSQLQEIRATLFATRVG